jgi:hypothetical protein
MAQERHMGRAIVAVGQRELGNGLHDVHACVFRTLAQGTRLNDVVCDSPETFTRPSC